MGADLSIDYEDQRESSWVSLAPQSWLRDHWLPIAEEQDWEWIRRVCDNTCQAFDPSDIAGLLTEMRALRTAVANSRSIDAELAGMMDIRLERAIAAIAADEDRNWQGVTLVSIG